MGTEKDQNQMSTTPVNTVVQDAVSALNKQNAEAAQEQALSLIHGIQDKSSRIEGCQGRIAELRKELAKLAKDVVDETTVFGGTLPANANRETIAKVIEKANKDRQYQVETVASRLTTCITSEQDAITMLEKSIVEQREKLAKVSVPTVSVAQIAG